MKDLLIVTCLYFQILLVQCDIFVNNLNGSDAAPIKMCIQKTINHLFSQNDTLNMILNGSDLCEDVIFGMSTSTMRPYNILNMGVINEVNKVQYDGQFIICPNDLHSLNHAMYRTLFIAGRNNRTMGSSKILVITTAATYAPWMFDMFWSYGFNNVIILVYGQGTSKFFMCNRFAPENECGKTAKLITDQDCEEQLSLSFTSVIHQMNKCPITFLFYPNGVYVNERHPTTRSMQYNIVELSHRLNATFQRTMVNEEKEYYYLSRKKEMIVISWGAEEEMSLGVDGLTEPLIRTDVLWLVPKAQQISNMNVCLKVFNYDVWIATSVVFICVWLTWFLIISFHGGFTFDKLCLSFLNVWSLTIFGNVAQVPRSLALRILFLFYLIYAINMQFAFTCDMSTVLTAPQYEFQIRTLEELADSQLPIYTYHDCKNLYFKNNYTDRKLYTKLQNSIHCVTDDEYAKHLFHLHNHGNYAVITNREEVRQAKITLNEKVEGYEITDSSITPTYKIRLRSRINHYFTTTLNTFIGRMIESGIYEKRKNDFYLEGFGAENVDTTPQDDLLTLKHLTFIFIFFGFGLCTAFMVFCFELVLHKYL